MVQLYYTTFEKLRADHGAPPKMGPHSTHFLGLNLNLVPCDHSAVCSTVPVLYSVRTIVVRTGTGSDTGVRAAVDLQLREYFYIYGVLRCQY